MKQIIAWCCLLVCLDASAQQSKNMTPLFNGKDLSGWHSFLTSKGINNDPDKIFSVEDGILHISGKEFGYICTDKEYNNFHLVVECRWGTKKWPPRDADTTKRDNGILYFVQLKKDTVWPKSIECQIQETDIGDFWMIDSATIVVDGMRTVPKNFASSKKKLDAEKPVGEWNRVEVIADHGKLTHIVNGKVVNEATDASLTNGRIIIQSEGAEIYYRKIALSVL
ncbi:MAG: DUF1080 domain-containing protein [Chitinophagaceae bacterium]